MMTTKATRPVAPPPVYHIRKGPPPGVQLHPSMLKGLRGRKLTKAAKACVSNEIAKHCRKKRGKCRKSAGRAQAVAIGYSICRRRGFRVPKR